jgi:electron transfer flavoprotein alpha subunit
MADMFAFAEMRDGALRKPGLEAVSAARRAADATGGGAVHALVLGVPGSGATAAPALGRVGADVVHVVEHDALGYYSPEVAAATATALIRGGAHRVAFFSASAQGRDLAPRVAAALDAGFAADVTAFELEGDTVVARHPVYTGKLIATLRVAGTPAVLSLRPGALTAAAAPREARIEVTAPAVDPTAARVRVTGQGARGDAKLDLGEAPVVVAGGRGLKAAEHFALLEELAGVIGNAAVGATRAVTDDGWRDPADQIGQTGRLVSPDLYVAVGISGAIQHLAGMRTSRVIVAINRDREAPIFKVADYGIVGDLFEVVPRLTEEVRRLRAES